MFTLTLDVRHSALQKLESAEHLLSTYGPQETLIALGDAFALREMHMRATASAYESAGESPTYFYYLAARFGSVADSLRGLAYSDLAL